MTEKMLGNGNGNGDVGVSRREFLRVGLAASLVPFLGCSSSGGSGVEKEGPKSICSIGCDVDPKYKNNKVLKPFAKASAKIVPKRLGPYVVSSDHIIGERLATTKDGFSVVLAFVNNDNPIEGIFWQFPGGKAAIEGKTNNEYWDEKDPGIKGNRYRTADCS